MEVYCWGRGEDGQLGLGDNQDQISPKPLEKLRKSNPAVNDITQVVCGSGHTVVLTRSGKLYTWGRGDDGRLGHGDNKWRYEPLEVGCLSLVVVKQVTCGSYHTAAVTDCGELYTWGGGMYGKLGHGGENGYTSPQLVEGLHDVEQVACGSRHTVVLTRDSRGTRVFAWGDKQNGVTGLGSQHGHQYRPAELKELADACIIQIAACGFHTGAVSGKGEIYTWGEGKFGRLGRGGESNQIFPMMIKDPVLENQKITQIACGGFHTAAITEDGKLYTWGGGEHGQLGHGNKENCHRPTLVQSLLSQKLTQVTCGWSHTVALTNDGNVYTWGNGDHGKLGHNNKKKLTVPQLVEYLKNKSVCRVASYNEHTAALADPQGKSRMPKFKSTMMSDLKTLVNNPTFSDVCFIVEGRKAYAHRSFLAARSDHFRAMFESGMRESTEMEITLPSHPKIRYEVFVALLGYIYTDSIKGVSPDVAIELFTAADLYRLDHLKELCEILVCDNLDDINAPILLKLADDQQDMHLRDICMKYVVRNFETISKTENFGVLDRHMILEILQTR
mmetsp:Transcript_21239/g.27128  ORF Transcript_21239/g.27128 Transcript_21239/m.27128 type:complete len:558 (+) Transcript_21239:73-1746(+)|eukprot:CAMPEP_0204832588 /NCGR_PEP_ID=MMETSP1346-20131115/14236_1 /ASSEMBLY_ACC=CAM_ASM_000771 /TAXON_ID=215587 /ORGANISM="Aplanochytrium stocchinoi, Strain GSBS06" /LENGTH=557 /DNA_ID=CAMNT_0051964513 /DNA_START=246 /DNA_END=1919 /DNA_ORIENTATION=+